jgi:hypothetical protein
MRKFAIAALLPLLIVAVGLGTAEAQTNVTVDPAKIVNGYMNVYELDGTTYVFESGWGLADLTAVFSGYDLTLGPNCIGDINEFWYKCVGDSVPPNCGGPGAPGNKVMEANAYAQETGTLSGQLITFSGEVLAYSLTSAHPVIAFIKDFASDYSSYVESSAPLTATGSFSISLDTIDDPGRHVQYGFQMKGVNVWVTDLGPFGSITIGPDYSVGTENTTWGGIKALLR